MGLLRVMMPPKFQLLTLLAFAVAMFFLENQIQKLEESRGKLGEAPPVALLQPRSQHVLHVPMHVLKFAPVWDISCTSEWVKSQSTGRLVSCQQHRYCVLVWGGWRCDPLSLNHYMKKIRHTTTFSLADNLETLKKVELFCCVYGWVYALVDLKNAYVVTNSHIYF